MHKKYFIGVLRIFASINSINVFLVAAPVDQYNVLHIVQNESTRFVISLSTTDSIAQVAVRRIPNLSKALPAPVVNLRQISNDKRASYFMRCTY